MKLRRDVKVTSTLLMLYFSGDKCDKTTSVHLKYITEISLHLLFVYVEGTYEEGIKSSGAQVTGSCEPSNLDAGNWTPSLYKSNKCSQPLRHFFSPHMSFYWLWLLHHFEQQENWNIFLKICVDVSYFQSGKFTGVPGSIWEAVVGGSIQVWGQPRLYSKFRASRGYITRLRKKEEFLNTPGNEQTAISIEKEISGKLEANKA